MSNFNTLRLYLSYSIKISVYFYGFLYNLQKSAKCNDSYTFHFRCKRIYPTRTKPKQHLLLNQWLANYHALIIRVRVSFRSFHTYCVCTVQNIWCNRLKQLSHLQNSSRIICYALLTNATNVILSGFVNNPGYKSPAFLHFLYVTFTAPSNWLVLCMWLSSLSSLLYILQQIMRQNEKNSVSHFWLVLRYSISTFLLHFYTTRI